LKIDEKVFKKNKIVKKIDNINKLVDSIEKTNETIKEINNTLIICNGEIVDRKNFSIMSLPSTREVLRDL